MQISRFLLFTKSISQSVFNSSDYQVIVVFCVLISLSETLIGIPLLILRIEERASKYSFVVMTSSVISMLAQVYFIIYTNYKLEGIFLSKVIAPSLIFLSLIPILTRSLELKFNNIVAKEVLIFCYPLMLASLVSTLLNSQDRFILGYITDSKEVGLYGLGCNIAGILTFLLISPLSLAFPVVFWKKINDGNALRFYSKSMTYSYFILVWAALALSLIAPHFIKIFAKNPDYWLAKNVVPFISFSLREYSLEALI